MNVRLVKILSDKRRVIFAQGKFDQWCVYILETDGIRWAPRDVQYFKELQQISAQYPNQKVYEDFYQIFQQTTSEINPEILQLIDVLAKEYSPAHQEMMQQWLTVLYAAMIAEENKAGAILKKRIKALGMHQILVENLSPEFAAEFSKGKNWKELDQWMKERGI